MRLAAATLTISERLARSLSRGATGAAMMPPSMAGGGGAGRGNHDARVAGWQPSSGGRKGHPLYVQGGAPGAFISYLPRIDTSWRQLVPGRAAPVPPPHERG